MSRPRVLYSVDLAALVDIADAAKDLDEMRQFYVDRPDEQQRIGQRVERLHAIVAQVAAQDAQLIYGPTEDA